MLTCTCTHTHTHTHTTQSQDVQLIATFTGGFPLAISHTFNIPANVLKLNMNFFFLVVVGCQLIQYILQVQKMLLNNNMATLQYFLITISSFRFTYCDFC